MVHAEKNNDGMHPKMDKLLWNVSLENSFQDLFNPYVDILATEEMKKLATDAMFKLEYEGKDVAKKSSNSAPDLTELEIQQSAWKDDYIINYVLRKNLRVNKLNEKNSFFYSTFVFFFKEAKREDRLQKEADDRVRKKASIDIPLLPSSRQDDRLAKLYRLETLRCKSKKKKKNEIRNIHLLNFSCRTSRK